MSPPTTDRELSRRRVLSAAGGAVAGGLVATGSGAAQARLTRRLVIPPASDFVTNGYDGFFVHVGEQTPGELDASVVDGCSFESWSPSDLVYHEGTLIDRLDQSARQVPTTVYTSRDENVERGSLWVINRTTECPRDYVGLHVEQIGASLAPGTVSSTATSTDAAGAAGPGFGALAGAAGVGGLLALLRRGGGDGGDHDG